MRLRRDCELTGRRLRLRAPSDRAPTPAMLREQTREETRVQAWGVAFVYRHLLESCDESTNRVEYLVFHFSGENVDKVGSQKLFKI